MHTYLAMLAIAATPGAAPTETFEWGRIQSPVDWILPLCVFVALATFAIFMYRRDCRELGGRPAVLLSSLRLLALLGLLGIYLQPQWRARRDVIDRSRAIILVDTSQSMERRDVDETSSASSAPTPIQGMANQGRSRAEAVIEELSSGALVPQLRQLHDVLVYSFDEGEQPALLATLPFVGAAQNGNAAKEATSVEVTSGRRDLLDDAAALVQRQQVLSHYRLLLSLASAIALGGLALVGAYLFRPLARGTPPVWLVVAGTTCLLAAIGLAGWTFRAPARPTLLALLGLRSTQPATAADAVPATETQPTRQPDWRELLAPRGTETRLGQAVYRLAVDQRNAPLAGIIVMSDGGQNAGLSVEDASAAAREAHIAVYPIGLGSKQETTAASWVNVQAHDRALPNDPFEVKARLRAVGLAGRSVTARLRQIPLKETANQPPAPDIGYDQQQEVLIGGPQENLAVKFDVPGIKTAGLYGFELSLEGRGASADPAASRRRFQIEIVNRKTKVLLIGGGPGREYRFLRNMLRRDKRIELDTWLQSSGVEQSKDDYPRLLRGFPDKKDQLYAYDCIVALDPDWTSLDENQAELLSTWVGNQAGGLIVAPGRVFAGSSVHNWLGEARLEKIRKLYPVEFPPVLFQAEDIGRKWTQARPIDLTRPGMEADFLRLADNPGDSQRIWSTQFEGVYATLPVRGAATGATVFARHIDPLAEAAGVDPIFLAERFFGSGRVFYVGSAELWRLRQISEGHFERFYTQLIDHVSKQRLHRSQRGGGALLLETDKYEVGDNVPVMADLKNVRDEPLEAENVILYVHAPGVREPAAVKLLRDSTRKGMFVGQFTAKRDGDYRLELPLPEGSDEPLAATLKVTTSAQESDNPQRNDDVLGQLAANTGGRYFIGLGAALGQDSETPLVGMFKDLTQTTPVLGDRDAGWDAFWTRFAMFGVCGVLALEWMLRRLLRLA